MDASEHHHSSCSQWLSPAAAGSEDEHNNGEPQEQTLSPRLARGENENAALKEQFLLSTDTDTQEGVASSDLAWSNDDDESRASTTEHQQAAMSPLEWLGGQEGPARHTAAVPPRRSYSPMTLPVPGAEFLGNVCQDGEAWDDDDDDAGCLDQIEMLHAHVNQQPLTSSAGSAASHWPQNENFGAMDNYSSPTYPPGICVEVVEGNIGPVLYTAQRVQWHIEDFTSKMLSCMNRSLVSPPFTMPGFPTLRLMIFPDARGVITNTRSPSRKAVYSMMVQSGPLYSSLKLKADDGWIAPRALSYLFFVGSTKYGPMRADFSQQVVHGVDDFGIDWLTEVDRCSDSVEVGVEFIVAFA